MRILFITHRWIGDAVLSTGVLAHLIEQYPDAEITVACGPHAVPLFEAVPNLSRIITMRKRRWNGHWLHLWLKIVGTHWDIIADMRGSLTCYVVSNKRHWRRQARHRYGHMVEQHAHIIDLEQGVAPRLWTKPEHVKAAEQLIPSGSPVLALGPIANWPGKEWPASSFADLASRVTASDGRFPGGRIAVLAGPSHRSRAEPLMSQLPADRRIDLIGVDLLTAYECLKRCALFIGNDSGTMHLAAASGVPTLGLFGPSRENHFRPWGAHSRAVRTPETYDEIVGAPGYDYKNGGSHMKTLSVDAVEQAVWDIMNHREAAA